MILVLPPAGNLAALVGQAGGLVVVLGCIKVHDWWVDRRERKLMEWAARTPEDLLTSPVSDVRQYDPAKPKPSLLKRILGAFR